MTAAAALLLALVPLARAGGKPLPPAPPDYVYNEGVLSPQGEAQISAYLASFEQATGHQMAVAAFKSLDGESLEDYTNRLFDSWGVGSKKRNDGVLFALYRDDRRWRVEVGYGLEPVVTDLEASEIARGYGVPRFRSGDFDGGTLAVVQALGAKIAGQAPPERPAAPESDPRSQLIFGLVVIACWLLLRFTLGGFGGGWGYGGYGGGWGGGGGGGFGGGGGMSGGGGASGGW